MRTALALLFYLESSGLSMAVDNGNVRFRGPVSGLSDDMKALVREHKPVLVKMLEARRKFDYREAALLPLVGHSVVTLQGSGELLSVFRQYCRVQLHRTGEVLLVPPGDLIALAVSEFTQEVAA